MVHCDVEGSGCVFVLPTFVVVLESVADALGHNVDSVSGPNCSVKPRSFELFCAEVGHLMVDDVLNEQDVSPKANELFKEDSVNLLRDGSGLFQVVKSPTSSQITKGPKNQQRNRMGQVVAGVPTVEVGLRVFGFGGQLLELRVRQPEFVAELLVVVLVHVLLPGNEHQEPHCLLWRQSLFDAIVINEPQNGFDLPSRSVGCVNGLTLTLTLFLLLSSTLSHRQEVIVVERVMRHGGMWWLMTGGQSSFGHWQPALRPLPD